MDSRRKLNIEIKFVVSDNAIIMSKHIVSKKNEKVIVFQFRFYYFSILTISSARIPLIPRSYNDINQFKPSTW